MILFPRPPLTIDLDRGPLQVALRNPPEVYRPSHQAARDASKTINSTAEPSRGERPSAGLLGAFLVFVNLGKRLRLVAEWCGVSPNTVKAFRDERLSAVSNDTPENDPPVTIGRDGKRRPAKQRDAPG